MAVYRLGDLVRECKQKIDRSSNPYEYYIAGEHMESNRLRIVHRGRFADSDVGPAFVRLFKPGQVLYGSRRTYLKKVAVADFEGVTSNVTFVLETRDENVLPQRLLPFVLLSDRFTAYSIGKSKGSTNPYVLFSDLADFEIDLPSIDKLREIESIMCASENLKEHYRSLIEACNDLVKSRFIEMFGDPISSTKWPKVRMKDVCDVRIGPFGSMLHKEDCVAGGHPLINPSHISNGELMPDLEFTVDDETYERLAAYKLLYGDVVLGRRGEMGRCAVVYRDDCLCGTGSMIVRPGSECRSDYIQKVISHPSFVEMLEHNAVGVTLKNLNAKTVGEAQFCLPPMALQNEYASFASQVDKSKFALQKTLDDLDAMTRKLMSEELGLGNV